MKINHVFAALSLLAFASCSTLQYSNKLGSNFAKTNETPCDGKQKRVSIFLENEKTDFKYVTIGTVEVLGNHTATSAAMLDRLQYETWSNCANAVINVKTTYINTGSGVRPYNRTNFYATKVLTGIAIRIADADLPSNISNKIDTVFIEHRQALAKQAFKNTNEAASAIVIGIITALILAAISIKR